MKKLQALAIASALIISVNISEAAQTVRLGGSCTKVNEVRLSGTTSLICAKVGKKLLWSKQSKTNAVLPQPSTKTETPSNSQNSTVAPSQQTTLQNWEVVTPPSGIISIYSGPKPVSGKNVRQSFEIEALLTKAKASSNLKLWIYDPENQKLKLGSPGVFLQKDGGDWKFIATDRNDGGIDFDLDPGSYTIDIVEPNGNSAKYDRGRYAVKVDASRKVSITGLQPNSAGYFTVTAVLKNASQSFTPVFQPTSACQLLDKTGSANMSNGFPRAAGRLPNHGVVKALIIPVEFTDLKGSGTPSEIYQDMAKGTADFYYKESQKTLRFEFTTLSSFVNLNVPVGSYKLGSYNAGDPTSYLQAGLAAVENEVDISNFDIVYVLPPSSVKPDQIAYGPAFPAALNSTNYQNASGRVLNASVGGADAWQNFPGAGWKWMAHETGHTFGLYDWYTLDGTNPYGPWDIMSLNWSTEAIELNAWNRYITGWLLESQVNCSEVQQLTTAGQTYKLEAIGLESKNPKAVMIKLSDSKILVIEARATAGLDTLQENQSGVLVYVVDTSVPTIKGIAQTYSRPGVDPNLRDAPLRVGEKISVSGVNIVVLSKLGLTYVVSISK